MRPKQYLPRLSFIRYLYNEALNKSKESEPQSAMSILLFHDSAELLLDLVSDNLGFTTNNIQFMKYWNLLSKDVPVILGHEKSMGKLNRIRVDLKHHGSNST